MKGTVFPEQEYNDNLVFGQRYHVIKDIGWHSSVRGELPNRNGEDMDGQDIIFWHKAYMPHSPEEGPHLWHSTGIRLVINGASPVDAPSPGDNDYYTVNGPCGAGEGDCDGSQECQAGGWCMSERCLRHVPLPRYYRCVRGTPLDAAELLNSAPEGCLYFHDRRRN